MSQRRKKKKEQKKGLGQVVRSIRRHRKLTQEDLAARSGLSADTIRRLEHNSFSPSLDTIRKLCKGLALNPSTLFHLLELGTELQPQREILDVFVRQCPKRQALALAVLRDLFGHMDSLEVDEDP